MKTMNAVNVHWIIAHIAKVLQSAGYANLDIVWIYIVDCAQFSAYPDANPVMILLLAIAAMKGFSW